MGGDSWEVRREEERVEGEKWEELRRHVKHRRQDDGFPRPKAPRFDNNSDVHSVRNGEVADNKSVASSSWRSSASSRMTKDRMTGGHIIPKLDEAIKTGTVVYFKGSKTEGKADATSQTSGLVAKVAGLTNAKTNANNRESSISDLFEIDSSKLAPIESAITTEDEFVERLAAQILEKTSRELDRHWYTHEESGELDAGRESVFDDSFLEMKGREDRYKRDHARLQAKKKMGVWTREQDIWELNRLTTVGLNKEEVNMEMLETTDDRRAIISVKEVCPAFLRGRAISQISNDEISVVKDPTSDLAVCARKGSVALNRLREETERSKMRERFWELAGTTLGKVLGLQDEKEIEEAMAAEEASRVKPISSLGQSLLHSSVAASKSVIEEQKARLPITDCQEDLMRVIRENAVTVVVGETGSGKTTQLTQFLYKEGFGRRRALNSHRAPNSSEDDELPSHTRVQLRSGMIGCTQPRRVAAVSVAKRVAEEFGCALGQEVGYSIRFEDCTTPEVTRIKYMTDAFLLREILSDADLDKYDAVVMDEAHERSLSTDVLFGLLKSLVARRLDLKLIVTSATMNAERFSAFFGGAPIFTIPGRTFPVSIEFSRSPCVDYVDAAVQKCLQVHLSFPYDLREPSDVLIFMTGQEDIEGLCILLSERATALKDKMKPLAVLPIYSQLPADLQAKVFERSIYRKVIVATNIAETSLTLEGIRFVIDAGFCKLKVFNPKIGMDTLQLAPISRANANQRSGRAGRTAPGICYRLYTERAFVSEMFETQVPEIQRTNLAHVVLLLKSLHVEDLLSFHFLDCPPTETILNAMLQLWMLGALDDQANLTPLGSTMAHLPVDPSLAKMILLSHKLQCSEELLTVVAMLSVPSIFYRPKGRAEEADASREKFAVPESDHLTLLNVFLQWNSNRCSPVWAAKHFIHQKALMKVRSVRDQLLEITRSQRIEPVSCGQHWDIIRKAISSGYFHHAAKLRGLGEYVNLQTSLPCHLHPSSSLFLSGLAPEYVVYHEVMMTTKEYMQNVTAIDPEWLSELGPMIFAIKQAGSLLR